MRGILPLIVLLTPALAAADDLSSPDPEVRARAADAAGRGEGEALRRLLRDESWKVRAAAARALGRLRHLPARRELMVLAQTDFSARVRAAAAAAVKQMDPLAYAHTLGTADLPPVRPAPPPPVEETAHDRAALVGAGLGANALRADESLAGQVAAGLRWPHVEAQLTLSFPAMALSGQVRWNILPGHLLVPYLTGGAALAYNNLQEELGSAASLFAGAGLRLGPPSSAAFWRRCYLYAEVLGNWIISQDRPAGVSVEPRRFSLPLLLGAGAELWP